MMLFALWLFTILLLVIIAVISLVYCVAISHRHGEHRNHDKGLYEKNEVLPSEIKTIYISLPERRYPVRG